ncbi:MAG: DUF2442 domain-containing protein [Tepidiformaceae bacterium]
MRVVRPYKLEVEFDNGESRVIDLEPELYGEVFLPLRDPDAFAQVYVDPAAGSIAWPNGADISPEWPCSAQAARV